MSCVLLSKRVIFNLIWVIEMLLLTLTRANREKSKIVINWDNILFVEPTRKGTRINLACSHQYGWSVEVLDPLEHIQKVLGGVTVAINAAGGLYGR